MKSARFLSSSNVASCAGEIITATPAPARTKTCVKNPRRRLLSVEAYLRLRRYGLIPLAR